VFLKVLFLFIGFVVGVAVATYKVFPFNYILKTKQLFFGINSPKISVSPLVSRFAVLDKILRKVDIVFLGDSIIQEGLFNEYFPDLSTANRGVGGDTAKHILLRLDQIYNLKPKKVFIMFGINDIRTDESIGNIVSSYEKIISKIKNKIQADIFVVSTIECNKDMTSLSLLKKVRIFNEKLQDVVKHQSIEFIDVNKNISTPEEGLKNIYTYDGIHLSGLGYDALYEAIKSYIYH
jgi:lysophospholipase L1-like esterase